MTHRGFGGPHAPIGAVGVLALLALVAAIGFFGPKRGSGEAPAPTQSSTATNSASPSVRPIVVATPTPTPRPRTPEPTLAPGAIFVGHPISADWSPAGNLIAVLTSDAGGPSGTVNTVRILERDGAEVARVGADLYWWLDNDDYVGQQFDTTSDPIRPTAFVGRVGVADPLMLFGQGQVRVLGRGSRVAIVDVPLDGPSISFSTWSPKGSLGSFLGMPLAFSADGSRLAFATLPANFDPASWNVDGAPDFATTLQVIDTSTGKVVASAPGATWPSGSASFSPDGRYVAFGWTTGPSVENGVSTATSQLRLLEVANGRHWQFDYSGDGFFQWDDKSHLTIWNESGAGPKANFPVAVGFAKYRVDDSIEVESNAGWRASWHQTSSKLTFDTPNGTTVVDVGGAIRNVSWSPQGTELVVVWGTSKIQHDDTLASDDAGQFVSILRP